MRDSSTGKGLLTMHHALWQSVLGEIELSVSHAAFTTWFKNTELVEQTDDAVTIAVPNIFAKRQFEVKFNDQIKSVLEKNGATPAKIIYVVQTSGGKKTVTREITPAAHTVAAVSTADELLSGQDRKSVV